MFQQLIKITVLTTIWRRYRHIIIRFLLLLGFWLVLNFIHQDFLEYARIHPTEVESFVAYTFIAKWLLILLSGGWFIWQAKSPQEIPDKNVQSAILAEPNQSSSKNVKKEKSNNLDSDPFENIRTRKKLRSEADIVLERDSNRSSK